MDGRFFAYCNLIKVYRPNLIGYVKISKDNHRDYQDIKSFDEYHKSEIGEYDKNSVKDNMSRVFMEILLSYAKNMSKTDSYYDALQCISKTYELYMLNRTVGMSLPFSEYALKNIQCAIAATDCTPDSTKSCAKRLIETNQEAELLNILDGINNLALKKYYSLVIGKPAHQGPAYKYHWGFTECNFWLNCKFKYTSDGRIAIADLNDNIGYHKYYAPGNINERNFKAEMEHLMRHMGLAFDQFDLVNGIIFDKESTEKLLSAGINVPAMAIQVAKANLFNNNRFFRVLEPRQIVEAAHQTSVISDQDNNDINRFDIRWR